MGSQNQGQLPRSRQQLYDLKFKMNKSDQINELPLYSKQKDETVVLEHQDVPEDLWILGKPHMYQDLSRFCTSDSLSHPYSVDPTFNLGKFEVTPFSYKQRRGIRREQGKHRSFWAQLLSIVARQTRSSERSYQQ